jgi:hypothetical protein
MRQKVRIMSIVFAALLLLTSVSYAKSAEMTMLKGELISVNPDAHMLTVKDSQGNVVEFTFTSSTEISGAGETIEGLAGKTGTSVTVHYREESGKKIATKVDVQSDTHAY